jgi:ribosomal protein S27E
MKELALTLLIAVPLVVVVFFLRRWNKRRARRQVVRIFKKHNAIGLENAKTVNRLGLKPSDPIIGVLVSVFSQGGGEDIRQDALDYLKQASIVKSTSDGRLYLAVVPCEGCGHNNLPNTLLCAECGATLVTPVQQAFPVEEFPGYEEMRRAGTLNIWSGALIVVVGVTWQVIGVLGPYLYARTHGGKIELAILPGLPAIIYGLLVLVSGIFARRGKRWGLALIGSILALPVPVLGTIATISLIQARYDWPNALRWLAYITLAVMGLGVVAVWALLAAM